MATPDFSVAGHLKKVPPAVRMTVLAARRTVKAAAPKAREIAYRSKPPRSSRAMWKLARYSVDGAYAIGLGTFPKHATLFFYRGSDRHVERSRRRRAARGEATRAESVRARKARQDRRSGLVLLPTEVVDKERALRACFG